MNIGCCVGCSRGRRGRGDRNGGNIIRARRPSDVTTAAWGEGRSNSGVEEMELQPHFPSKC